MYLAILLLYTAKIQIPALNVILF